MGNTEQTTPFPLEMQLDASILVIAKEKNSNPLRRLERSRHTICLLSLNSFWLGS